MFIIICFQTNICGIFKSQLFINLNHLHAFALGQNDSKADGCLLHSFSNGADDKLRGISPVTASFSVSSCCSAIH